MISAEKLRQCVDYVVDSPDGRIGTVAEVRYTARDASLPEALAVRAGRASNRLLIIPLSQLTDIIATNHMVVLLGSPVITTSEPIAPAVDGQRRYW